MLQPHKFSYTMPNKKSVFELADQEHELGNYQKALNLFLAAANQGDADAMSRIASMYDAGEGVTPDVQKAINWWKLAAQAGSISALTNLGIEYFNCGDFTKAQSWLERALKAGDAEAALLLAKLLEKTSKNTDEIRNYLEIVKSAKYVCEESREGAIQMLQFLKKSDH